MNSNTAATAAAVAAAVTFAGMCFGKVGNIKNYVFGGRDGDSDGAQISGNQIVGRVREVQILPQVQIDGHGEIGGRIGGKAKIGGKTKISKKKE